MDEAIEPDHIKMTHIAMVEEGNKEVTEMDDMMKKWMNTKEEYYFTKVGENETNFEVRIVTDESFEEMMGAWTKALEYFKEICEQ